MLKLILGGNEVFVHGRSMREEVIIDQVTRFRDPKAIWSKNYGDGKKDEDEKKWDGYRRLFKAWEGTFPIGMLFDVEMQLLINDIPYEIVDKRIQRVFKKVRLRYDGYPPLYYFQQEALDAILRNKIGIISLPTGTGKTRLAQALIGEVRLPTIFFVTRERLLAQTMKGFQAMFGCKIGQIGRGKMELRPITVATVQTAYKMDMDLFSHFGIWIFDEVHHVAADTVFNIAKHSTGEYLIGLSATPTREDGKEMMLQAGIGRILYYKSASQLIAEGFLAIPEIAAIEVDPINFDDGHNYEYVVREAIVHNRQRNLAIALGAVEDSLTGKVYIHVNRLDHGPILTKMINSEILSGEKDRRAVWLCGKDTVKKKDDVLHDFDEGNLKILVSTLLGEGVDIPSMYSLFMAAGGGKGAKVTTPQILGRVLRRSEHRVVKFTDIADRCKYLGDHFKERCKYYNSEAAFAVDPLIQSLGMG